VLEKNWAHDILETILSSSQGTQVFMDWKIEVENLNAILTTSVLAKVLTMDQLKDQCKGNLVALSGAPTGLQGGIKVNYL
jgi:hypothetical protein